MKITIKIHPHTTEEVKQLANLLNQLNLATNNATVAAEKFNEAAEKTKKPVKKEEKFHSVAPAVIQQAQLPVDTGNITDDKIRTVVQEKIQKGHRDAVKATLNKYGAANVSALKSENYTEFYETIKAL